MKPTILLFLALLLTACTAPTPSPTPTATATASPTLPPTATPTPTSTPIPTLPPEQVGGGRSESPASSESLSFFAINGFYIPFRVAQNQGIDTPQQLEQYLRTEKISYFVDLGATWGRIHPDAFGSFAWGNVDPDLDGTGFDFTYQDIYVRLAQENGVQLLPSLSPLKEDQWLTAASYIPTNMEAYKAYVQATVERYDGDGVADMTGLRTAVKYWQLDNEADLRNQKRNGDFSGFMSPDEYLQVLAATHQAMKAADAQAGLMINLAGVGQEVTDYGLEYLRRLVAKGASPYFEVHSYHVYPLTYDEAAYESELDQIKSIVGSRPIWITETAITSRSVRGFSDAGSEAEQARWLARSYVYHVANGVSRLFWLSLTDGSPALPERTAKYSGLMTFGPPPQKKAAYYTFRLLSRKLSQAVRVSSLVKGRYVFEFPDGKKIAVLWSSTPEIADLSQVFGSTTLLLTRIVEDASRPEPATERVPSTAVPVSESPVLVEVAAGTSANGTGGQGGFTELLVSNPQTGIQINSTVAVNEATGRVYVAYLDSSLGGHIGLTYSDQGGSFVPRLEVAPMVSGQQKLPDIAVDEQGNVHLAWQNNEGGVRRVYFLMTDSERKPLGAPIMLAPNSGGKHQIAPSLAVSKSGGTFIAWLGCDEDGQGNAVNGHIYIAYRGPDGAIEGPFQVDDADSVVPRGIPVSGLGGVEWFFRFSEIAADPDSESVWLAYGVGDLEKYYLARFDAATLSTGLQVEIPMDQNVHIPNVGHTSTAMGGGKVFVAFVGEQNRRIDVFLSTYAPGSGFEGKARQITSEAVTANQAAPHIGADAIGNVYAVWEDSREGAVDIYFASSPNNFSDEQRVNTVATGEQAGPRIYVSAAGGVWVTWHDLRGADADVYIAVRSPQSEMAVSAAGVTSAANELVPLWYLTRGGPKRDSGWAVTVDTAGNLYWAPMQTLEGSYLDVYLYKLTPEGQEVWKTRWGGPWHDRAFILAVDGERLYMGGSTNKDGDMAVVAFDIHNGRVVWEFTWDQGYGYEEVDGLVVDGGFIYLAGWTRGKDSKNNDLAVLKLDLSGKLVWSKTWGTPKWDEANGQIVVDAENVYVAGRYNAPWVLQGGDALLVAFDKATGAYKWHKTWGGAGLDDALGMIGDLPYLYVVGMTSSFGQGFQIFLNKYDTAGNLLWSRIWGGTREEVSRTLAIGKGRRVFVGGQTTSYGKGQNDIVLLRYDPDGSLDWFKTWGGSKVEKAHGIIAHEDFLYIAGETSSFGAGQEDALLIKLTGF